MFLHLLSVLLTHVANHFLDISICMFHRLLRLHMYYLNTLTQPSPRPKKTFLIQSSSSQAMVPSYLVITQIVNARVI